MIEEFVSKTCVSCIKQCKPKDAQYKMCDGCFSRCDKKAPKLSSADTSVTMTPAVQESFKHHRKFKSVQKNVKHWSSKKNGASSSSGPLSKKDKSGAVHMITTFNDEGFTEHTSKKSRLASPDIENGDQSVDDESDNDLQVADVASSSIQGGVTSRDDKDLSCHLASRSGGKMTREILVILPRLDLRHVVHLNNHRVSGYVHGQGYPVIREKLH
jgi:hypothetical protein